MADTQQPVDQPVEEQVTSKVPVTKQKNPKRVAAGKAIAAKTKKDREDQKKALIDAQSIIARSNLQVDPTPSEPTPVEPTPVELTPVEPAKNVLTTTQWLSIVSIVISLVGLYYKREEIKKAFTKKADPLPMPQALPPREPLSAASRKIRQMD